MASTRAIEPDAELQGKFDEKQVALMREMCIAVNEEDLVVGARSKKDCHLMENIHRGLWHRAFSVLLFNSAGEFLLTRRSDAKITFPGYFTNACCSHPLHTELELEEENAIGVKRAAQRRLFLELGIPPLQVPLSDMQYMTRILYQAPSNEVWGEAEVDYLIVIQKDVDLKPDPDEVQSVHYLGKESLPGFLESVEAQGQHVSPWFKGITKSYLYNYWNNLGSLQKLEDHQSIHRV